MIFRVANALMTALFAVAVAVQYNDPDPIRWMAIYGAAGALSAWAAVRGGAPFPASVAVGLIALVWGLVTASGVNDRAAFSQMFQSWEMKSPSIEEAREASGLLIAAGWMAVLAMERWLARG